MKITNLLLVALALGLSACSSDEPSKVDNDPKKTISVSRSEQNIVESQADIAFSMFKAVAGDNNQIRNVVLSPLSFQLTLSMLANGTTGDLNSQMLHFLGGENVDEINSFNARLLGELPALNPFSVKMYINNSLWVNSNYGVADRFRSALASHYNAEVNEVDFAKTSMKDELNAWASKKTNGLIKKVLDNEIDVKNPMLIANSLYFKAKWHKDHKFSRDATKNEDFFDSNGLNPVTVPMMHKVEMYVYAEEPGLYQAISVEYGNSSYEMVLILPEKGITPVEMIDRMGLSEYRQMFAATGNSRMTRVTLSMPKFDIAWRSCITDYAKDMDLDFAGNYYGGINNNITDFDLIQATRIIVDEEGTEAAAVTSSGDLSAAPTPAKAVMNVNRPFVFLIRERSTGAILFIGSVADPR